MTSLWGFTVATANRSTSALSATERTASRRRVSVPARLTWKDAQGAVRFASVTTRDLSESGAFVECSSQAPIPVFHLVHLQLESSEPLAAGGGTRVLAAVWRVQPPAAGAGCPSGYALRFMLDPAQAPVRRVASYAQPQMAVAS